MTNNNPTIALTTAAHGLFRIDVDHFNMTLVTRFNRAEDILLDEVHALVGEETNIGNPGTYSDLSRSELLILISYLTGGATD